MLIVDDEPIICKGLHYTIDWASIGIEFVDEAYSGEEALRKADENPPDLVLTDIMMKKMDGLMLAEQLKSRFPGIRIVMISGHEQFDYARQAVRIGVEDYLLKPVDVDELILLVSKLRTQWEAKQRAIQSSEEERWGTWLSTLFHTGADMEKDSWPTGNGSKPCFRFVASQMEYYSQWRSSISAAEQKQDLERWRQGLEAALWSYGFRTASAFYESNLLVTVCIEELEHCSPLEDLIQILKKMAAEPPWTAHALYYAVSDELRSAEEARPALKSVVEMLKLKVITQERVLGTDDKTLQSIRSDQSNRRAFPDGLENDMFQSMFQHDNGEKLNEHIRYFFRWLAAERVLLEEAMLAYEELRHLIMHRLRSGGIKTVDSLHFLNILQIDFHYYNSYEALEELVTEEAASIYASVHSAGAGKHYWVIERARQYIDAHSGNNDLKATDVASTLQITPSYFSQIFKQHTGQSFTEYVNKHRIHQAKVLLEDTSLRVFEIATQVGYKEYKYFVSVFKDQTGMTPSEYRDVRVY